MSYHKFSNIGEIFNGDLSTKLMEGVESQDYMTRSCNCNSRTKVDGKCIYNSKCRQSVVVYKATCKCCGKFYIGNTQNKVKDRISGHLSETRNLVRLGIKSDSFASHFASHFASNKPILCREVGSAPESVNVPKVPMRRGAKKNKVVSGEKKKRKLNDGIKLNEDGIDECIDEGNPKSKLSIGDIRKIVEVDVLWKGNPINHMKKFGTVNCGLCMKERLAILEAMKRDEINKTNLLINSSGELYGACRHRTRFHRFLKNVTTPPSADEGLSPEKSDVEDIDTLPNRYIPLSTVCADTVCAKDLAKNFISLTEDV